jgi:eukaryotic-like serine/threonine-protein kinase
MQGPRAPWWVYSIAACLLGYVILSTYAEGFGPEPLGTDLRFRDGRAVVVWAAPGFPAARAGIEAGDEILATGGQPLRTLFHWRALLENLEVGRPFALEISRGGERRDVRLQLGPNWRVWTAGNWLTFAIKLTTQLVTLGLALLVATRRHRERVAMVGALFLASLSVTNFIPVLAIDPHVPALPAGGAAIWRGLPLWIGAPLWLGFLAFSAGPLAQAQFFAEFPRPAFRTARAWWTWALLWSPVVVIGMPGLLYSGFRDVYRPGTTDAGLPDWFTLFTGIAVVVAVAVGMALLVLSFRRLVDRSERRRLRVLVAGAIVGLAALTPVSMAGFFNLPAWASAALRSPVALTGASVLFLVLPASFAYAILRHQVFDVGVILRQGLQYALARWLVVSLVPACAVVLAIDLVTHGDEPLRNIVVSRGWIYAAVAAVALLAHFRRHHWLDAIDRRFFRERYDAQRLLSQVVEEIRGAANLQDVAADVVARVAAALHPTYVAVLVRAPREAAYRVLAGVPANGVRLPLSADSKLVALTRLLGKPLDVGPGQSGWISQQLPPDEGEFVRRSGLGLIVPVGQTEALLVLGAKRSEEPYSSEDRQLLGAIAAGLALLIERPGTPPAADAFTECPSCGTCGTPGVAVCAADGSPLLEVPLPRLLAGRYRLDRRLGRGGMGTVYEAIDLELGRSVAVKVIREELVGSPAAADRFRLEARAAAGFSHPNVVVVHDFGVARETRAFLVMELLRGASLREVLRRDGRLAPARATGILRDLAAAVDAAHARHLVHRDLKPENVFLAGAGVNAQVKLLDFGVAKFLAGEGETEPGGRTATGQVVGTVHYMGPEQLRGQAPGVECDVWAIAVMTYEMLAGVLPFEGATAADYQSSVLSGHLTPIRARLPEASPRLDEFFARALSPNPAERPGRAPALVADLEQALATAAPGPSGGSSPSRT